MCVRAAREQTVIYVGDTAHDARWPEFGARAAALGVHSMLCVALSVDENCLGTLSLYSEATEAFNEHDVQLTQLYATHAALALSDAQRTSQLVGALKNRDLIGQAKGILMERLRVTPDEAFHSLSAASQAANRKLIAVAQHLVDTGELLGASNARR